MSLYLAVDAGGTKTDYVLADETRVLARVRSATIKRMRTDADSAAAALDGALAELARATGHSARAVTRTCIGTAGETVPLVADWLREAFAARVGGSLLLLGDVEIALDAAFPGGSGVLVLAGTGSNVAGRGLDGAIVTAGGWGPALADQGSGHRIGHEAMRRIMLAHDRGETTALTAAILTACGLATLTQLVEYANRHPAPDSSKLVETVLRTACQGDAIAQEVLRVQGEDLGELAGLILTRLQAADRERFVPRIAFAGSIMEHVTPVREALIARVGRDFPNLAETPGVVDPIAGALWRARNAGVSA